MSSYKMDVTHLQPPSNQYDIQPTRDRQTASGAEGLTKFTMATANVLFYGTSIAAGAVGGPAAAMAVAGAGQSLQNSLAEGGTSGSPIAGGAAAAAGAGTGMGTGTDTMSQVQRMQSEGMASSFQLLALQQKVQDENRQFTTLSNVMRARHDTDKAAIGNIRS